MRKTALPWPRPLRDTALLRSYGLRRIGALQRAGALKRIVSLKGIVPLRPSVLALPLILLLALLRLSNGGAARKDCESCDDTLRLKCNFYHKTHLISGKDTGALSSLQLANLLGAARPMAAVSNFGRKIPKYSLNSKPAILTDS